MSFKIPRIDVRIGEAWTRIPFRYGNACLTAVPLVMLRVTLEKSSGKYAQGFSGDCLPPLWFDKNPDLTYRKQISEQLAAIEMARGVNEEFSCMMEGHLKNLHELWEKTHPMIQETGLDMYLPRLMTQFGISLVERAAIDALCRLEEVTFREALTGGLLGYCPPAGLPEPSTSIQCRHTVGLGDALRVGDIPDDERLEDGLPQALEEDIATYGLTQFKVKIQGDREADFERLEHLAGVLEEGCPEGYQISLDGNEQYTRGDELLDLLRELESRPRTRRLIDSILFIEQPLPREIALEPTGDAGLGELANFKPVIIDESDDCLEAFPRAVELGYRGCSIKNCKGIFKALHNRALCDRLNEEAGEGHYFQTGEDLANLPVLSLQQDLATLAVLGLKSAERNGHHYFPGLDHLPPSERESALLHHPDLYHATEQGVRLRVEEGRISCRSLLESGYGYTCDIDFEARTPVGSWKYERLRLKD